MEIKMDRNVLFCIALKLDNYTLGNFFRVNKKFYLSSDYFWRTKLLQYGIWGVMIEDPKEAYNQIINYKSFTLYNASTIGLFYKVLYLAEKGVGQYDLNISLTTAALNGHLKIVKYLLQMGADIHYANDDALRWAAGSGRLEVVKYLVEKGANIWVSNYLALSWASQSGYLETVKYLVEQGSDINLSRSLSLASAAGQLDVVKYLVKQGADVHAFNDEALRLAKNIEIVEYLETLN